MAKKQASSEVPSGDRPSPDTALVDPIVGGGDVSSMKACEICKSPIIVEDAGGDLHCQQGHSYAANFKQFEFGPITTAEIERLKKEATATDPPAASPQTTIQAGN